jgi:hypothetical protein
MISLSKPIQRLWPEAGAEQFATRIDGQLKQYLPATPFEPKTCLGLTISANDFCNGARHHRAATPRARRAAVAISPANDRGRGLDENRLNLWAGL